jgi:hypothetical protein
MLLNIFQISMNPKYLVCLLTGMLILPLSAPLQAQDEVIASVRTAFKTGKSQEVARFFNANLELIIQPEDVELDNASGTQAELVLRKFFEKYPVREFSWDGHQGASPNGGIYRTGTYESGNGKFTVFMVLKQNAGRYIIDRLWIQK